MLPSAHSAERKFMALYANFRRPRSQIRDSALSNYASGRGQSPSSSKHEISPTKLANRVLHPKRGNVDENIAASASNKRRQASECETPDRKRVRGGLQSQDKNVIVLDDDSDDPEIVDTTPGPSRRDSTKGDTVDADHSKVLDFFRLRPKKVG